MCHWNSLRQSDPERRHSANIRDRLIPVEQHKRRLSWKIKEKLPGLTKLLAFEVRRSSNFFSDPMYSARSPAVAQTHRNGVPSICIVNRAHTFGLPITGCGRPTHSFETIVSFGHFSLTNSTLRPRKNRASFVNFIMIVGYDRRSQCRAALGAAGIGDDLRQENRQYPKCTKEHADETFSPTQWGLCALRHGIQISMEAILACHPARSTECLDCHPK